MTALPASVARAPRHDGGTGPGPVPEGVVLGDCRGSCARLPDGCVDLVYIDPPFGTGQVRRLGSIRTGAGAKERVGFGGRRYPFEVVSDYRYRDDMSLEEYLEFLRQRLRRCTECSVRRGRSTSTSTFTPPTTPGCCSTSSSGRNVS